MRHAAYAAGRAGPPGRVLWPPGTFCKTFFPALRLGYLEVPPALVELPASGGPLRYAIRRWALRGSCHPIAEGHFQPRPSACAAPFAPAATPCCGWPVPVAAVAGGGRAAPAWVDSLARERVPDRRGGSRRVGSQRPERLLTDDSALRRQTTARAWCWSWQYPRRVSMRRCGRCCAGLAAEAFWLIRRD